MSEERADLNEVKKRSIVTFLADNGVKLTKAGAAEMKCCCPLPDHNDGNASFYVNTNDNVFKCHGCGKAGSIVDLVMALNVVPLPKAVEILTGKTAEKPYVTVRKAKPSDGAPPKLICEHVYKSETGKPLYFVKRFSESDGGKTFRQGYINENGIEIMSMKDVKRGPYNLHLFGNAGFIWLAEGEKCADALCKAGLLGTTTVGGSGGWLDAYASYFKDRDVVILPDHDEPGEKYAASALESIKHEAKSIRVVRLGGPGRPKGFDVADYISELREELMAENDGREETVLKEIRFQLESRANSATPLVKGLELNISSMDDLKRIHANASQKKSGKRFDISKHLPQLEGKVRPFRTGDCIVIKGPTGSAKTLFAQAIARWAAPMKVLVFEIELAQEDLFARWAAMDNDCEIDRVNRAHEDGGEIKTDGLGHIYVCPCSNPTPQYIEETIRRAELVIGDKPDMVVVDYIQLVKWPEKCSRYERFSNIAEYFRVLPNATRTICIVISQVARPENAGKGERVPSRYDAKESGSIETSATLLLDIAPHKSPNIKKISVLKDTHSSNEGQDAEVGFIGEKGLFGEPVHMCADAF